ncbi:MAG: hypothetical protein KYX62_02785 [Pseudomonadota bacterium]|nr:hypothetical protein [Pseudomonadota bacterium]
MSIDLYANNIRQGSVIQISNFNKETQETIQDSRASKEHRKKSLNGDSFLIVLSQDCDLSNTQEKNVEIIIAKTAKPKEANNDCLQKTRSTRKLILQFGEAKLICEDSLISVIPKENLQHINRHEKLHKRQLEILIQWRINRYSRTPLPDKFNRSFISGYLLNEENHLKKFLETNYHHINDLFVYIYPETESASKYWVSITALLTLSCTKIYKDYIEQELLKHITHIHNQDNSLHMLQIQWEDHGTDNIPIQEVTAMPEDFSMADIFLMKKLTLDYLCWPDDE